MAPSQQKALVLESKFGELVINTVDVPKPGSGEILVKIQSAALNPIDWKIQKYGLSSELPTVLGKDLAGDVIEVGEGVTNVAVGDRIFLQSDTKTERGAFQQYAIAKADISAKIPHNLTYDDVSTLPVALITPYLGLFKNDPEGFGLPNAFTDGRNKSAGRTIVIIGGSSIVGQFTIQLSKLAGISTIITTASLKHTEWLKSLGATHVIDRNTPALTAEVFKITGNQAVKYVYDAISEPETQQAGYDLLASDGLIVITLSDSIKKKVEGKRVSFILGMTSVPQHREMLTPFFDKITSLLEAGDIKTPPVKVLPNGLAGVLDGFKMLQNNQVSGAKLVVHPQETA